MKDAQKPDHISLNTLIGRLREGRFVIPDFQREFEWKPWDVRDLMRSIFLDYYIGALSRPRKCSIMAHPMVPFPLAFDSARSVLAVKGPGRWR